MRIVRFLLLSISLVGLALTQTGCLVAAAAAAGTGAGAIYVNGKTEMALDATPPAIASATETAMRDMKIAVISNNSSDAEASIIGRTSSDAKVEVTAKSETERSSKIYIRVGVWGDKVIQWNLLDRVRTNLGLSPTTQQTARAVDDAEQ